MKIEKALMKTRFPKNIEKAMDVEFLSVFKEEYIAEGYLEDSMFLMGLDVGSDGFDNAFIRACERTNNNIVLNHYLGEDEEIDYPGFGADVQILMKKMGIIPNLSKEEKELYILNKVSAEK